MISVIEGAVAENAELYVAITVIYGPKKVAKYSTNFHAMQYISYLNWYKESLPDNT